MNWRSNPRIPANPVSQSTDLGCTLEENFSIGDQIQVYSPGFTTTNPMTGIFISAADNYLVWSTALATAASGVALNYTDLTSASVEKL